MNLWRRIVRFLRPSPRIPIVVPDCDVTALIQAIKTANRTGQPIELATDGMYQLTSASETSAAYGPTGLPVIHKTVTIRGNGATIVGCGEPESSLPSVLTYELDVEQAGLPFRLSNGIVEEIANSGHRILRVDSRGRLDLYSVTIRDGYLALNGGGAIHNEGTLSLTECTVFSNTAVDGGGIYNLGVLVAKNSTIRANHANGDGGGICNHGDLSLTDSMVEDNGGPNLSGGIHNTGEVTLSGTTVSGNFAHIGGGLLNINKANLMTSTVSENTSRATGGGICNQGVLKGSNCTVYGNLSELGGGISNHGALSLTNCTISRNLSKKCGGIYQDDADSIDAPLSLTLANTIVANNPTRRTSDVIGEIIDGGHNLVGNAKRSIGLGDKINGNLVGLNPLLDPVGLKDHGGQTQTIALMKDSPAIDAGNDAKAPETDQRGVARPQGAASDIGAFEYQSVAASNGRS